MTDKSEPHPLRCETCGHRQVNPNDDNYCEVIGDFIAGEIEMDTTAKVGCTSHTSATAAQERIDAVIRDLEIQIGCSNMLWEDGGDSYHDAYHQLVDECKKVIALLQAGRK